METIKSYLKIIGAGLLSLLSIFAWCEYKDRIGNKAKEKVKEAEKHKEKANGKSKRADKKEKEFNQ